MNITLTRTLLSGHTDSALEGTWGSQFVATSEATGGSIQMAGAPSIGPSEAGLRPMEALLASLAGCSAMDVLHILQKQKHTVSTLRVHVQGERADAIPAVFTRIELHYEAEGDFSLHKLERAVALSQETYCSVSHMLRGSVEIVARVTKLETAS